MRERAEEPVVGKRARVVEEVTLGKTRGKKTRTVQDTVRKTDVHVERYSGPERRLNGGSYEGVDRRRAA
jgi:stress response protein YsnF